MCAERYGRKMNTICTTLTIDDFSTLSLNNFMKSQSLVICWYNAFDSIYKTLQILIIINKTIH